ncbi:MAG: type II toxin-antitoxin system VapB family antitoxin [Cyanobium sp. Prado107]|jgi:antitoxin VapB|nr:type II toxin-antitoxin system VapB family antitoxin [Cyanobium sp. Prado107]
MGMNIKDPEVHAMARELAARRSTTVTDAVRQALRAELERSGPDPTEQEVSARKAALLDLLQRYKRLRWPDQRSSAELQAELYDDDGLPV